MNSQKVMGGLSSIIPAAAFTATLAGAIPAHAQTASCPGDSGGITLSPGFCATVFADKLGHSRHLAVAPNGVVYVNTWSGRYYHNDTPPPGGFLIALQSTRATVRRTMSSASAQPRRTATQAAPASRSTRTTSMPRPMTASCDTPCRQAASPRRRRRKR